MVHFVGVEAMIKLVEATGVQPFLKGLCQAIEDDFRRWPQFEKTPRVASHSSVGVIELMPTSDGEHYGFKYVNGHPKNMKEGLQTVTAFGVLSDVSTGYPILVSEMTLLTALRTAATSAMAAKHLARSDASCMAIIGNGAQSEFQALAFAAINGIKRLRLYDIDPATPAANVPKTLPATGSISLCAIQLRMPWTGADIVTTVTADKQICDHPDRQHGRRRNPHQRDRRRLSRQDRIAPRHPFPLEHICRIRATDARIEGEIQQLGNDHPVTELWKIINGVEKGRQSARDDHAF